MAGPHDACCNRTPSPKETTLFEAGFDRVDLSLLEVARYYWQTFATPDAQTWISALHLSGVRFPEAEGYTVGVAMLATVQAMRTSRTSCFRFNNPRCPHCSRIVSEHERHFMNALQAVRQGRSGPAKTHAMMLCEGNDTDEFLSCASTLIQAATPEGAREYA